MIMHCLFEKANQVYLSLKSYHVIKIPKWRNTFEFKCYCIIKFVYAYQVTPSLTWIVIFFFFCKIAFTLNCWLLSLLGCVTYNIERATTFAILVKYTKNFKPLKKMFQFPGRTRKNFIPENFSRRVLTETWDSSCFKKGLLEKQQSAPNTCNISPLKTIFFQNLINRCICEMSLKYIKLFQKYSLYWSYIFLILT